MNIPFLCVGIAFLLLYLSKIPVAIAMHRAGGYDNRNPREQQARLTGWGRRALAAHQNAFEAFAPFAAAVLVAQVGGTDPTLKTELAIAFIASRVLYHVLYLANLATLRSLAWGVGMLCSGGLLLAGIVASAAGK